MVSKNPIYLATLTTLNSIKPKTRNLKPEAPWTYLKLNTNSKPEPKPKTRNQKLMMYCSLQSLQLTDLVLFSFVMESYMSSSISSGIPPENKFY